MGHMRFRSDRPAGLIRTIWPRPSAGQDSRRTRPLSPIDRSVAIRCAGRSEGAVPHSLSEIARGPWHQMSNGLSIPATSPAKRQMTEETIPMKLTWYGHSAFRIEAGAAKILIDPFLSGNLGQGVDRQPCRRGLDTGRRTVKAIVVTDQAAGTAGMTLVERPEPQAAINDVVVQVHASGFVPPELAWPSTWTDRLDRDRTPSIPGHELAGVVTAIGYGTRGLSV